MKFLPCLIILAACAPLTLVAQELPRPSMTQHDQTNTLPTEYNMKAGPAYLNFTGSVDSEFNDNIGLSNSGKESDVTITPEVGIAVQVPVTKSNTLTLSTSVGFTKYVFHPQFDTYRVLVAPDSRLSFDIYTGNFKINLHDEFSAQQDPVEDGALSNIVTFDRFENIAGVGVIWDLNRVVLTLNYDHINFEAFQLQAINGTNLPNPDALDYSADQVSTSIEVHASSTLVAGIEAAASNRVYDHFNGNYTGFSAGPFMRIQLTQHVKAQVSGGYQTLDTPANGLSTGSIAPAGVFTGSGGGSGGTVYNGYYFNVSLDHELNKYYIERLSLGHETDLGYLAEQSTESYIDYTGTWRVNRSLNLALTLSYQDVNEDGGFIGLSSYDMFTGALQANFPISRRFSGAVLYQYSDKMADASNQSYRQNKVGATVTYHF